MPHSNTVRENWGSFVASEDGTTSIEYAVIAGGMASALMTAFDMLLQGGGLLAGIEDILNPAPPPPPPLQSPVK